MHGTGTYVWASGRLQSSESHLTYRIVCSYTLQLPVRTQPGVCRLDRPGAVVTLCSLLELNLVPDNGGTVAGCTHGH